MFDVQKFSDLLTEVQGNRSLNEYARNSGVSAAYISKLKNKVKKTAPSPIIIRKLASKSGRFSSSLADSVSYTAMMAAAGHITSLEAMSNEDFYQLVEVEEEANVLDSNLTKIAILGKIVVNDPILDEKNIARYHYEYTNNVPDGDLFILQAKGDSMEPTIPSGCMVLIRPQKKIENGEVVAVMIKGNQEVILRKLKIQGNIKLLMPDNNDHEPLIVTEENLITILGKAIRITVDL